MSKIINKVDVICEHKSDGTIIPLRFQLADEDGIHQRYTIKGYKVLEKHKDERSKDGLYVTHDMIIFECRIEVLETWRTIRLYCRRSGGEWKLAF